MKRVNERDLAYKRVMKVAKRVTLVILCSIPIVLVFAYLTRKVITSNLVQTLCFIVIMGLAVLIEEIITRTKEKHNQEISTNKDVFK